MKRGFICSSWSYLCQIIFNEKDLTREARSLAPRLILTKLNASLSSTRQTFCTRGERRFAQFGFPLAQKRIDKYFPPLLRFTRHRKQFRKSWLAPFFFSLSFLHFSFPLFFLFPSLFIFRVPFHCTILIIAALITIPFATELPDILRFNELSNTKKKREKGKIKKGRGKKKVIQGVQKRS